MTIRERLEQQEYLLLAPYATHAAETLGRAAPIPDCDMRTAFQRDRDRIIHCKSFRRLKFKTQVFLSPEGDHYRTRLTHTLEVAQVARTLARALRLNEDLTEAIALGHDLGHTPYGHIGERTLNSSTPEAECVRKADRIAYLNHDLDDALRAGILKSFELPMDCLKTLGKTHGERINTMIADIIEQSAGNPHLSMSEPVQSAMDGLREFMFDRVYRDGWRDPEEARCDSVIRHLFDYYSEHPGQMPEEFVMICYRDGTARGVCDFLSCMTDRYATRKFQELFVPSAFPAF